jgi:LEA14-like dessication related protein
VAQSYSGNLTSGATTHTLPSAVAAGDWILIGLGINNNSAYNATISDNQGHVTSNFPIIKDVNIDGMSVAWVAVKTSAAGTYALTINTNNASGGVVHILEISNADSSTLLDLVPFSNSAPRWSTNLTGMFTQPTTYAKDLLLVLVNSGFIAGGNSFTPTGSWQVVSGIPSGGMIGSQVYMYKPGVIGTYGISGTIGGSGAGFPGWEVIGLALKGSTPTPPPAPVPPPAPAPSADPVVAQSYSGNLTSGATTHTLPSAVAAGDWILIGLGINNNSAYNATISDNQGHVTSNFPIIKDVNIDGMSVAWVAVKTSAAGTYALTINTNNASGGVVHILEISNADSSTLLDLVPFSNSAPRWSTNLTGMFTQPTTYAKDLLLVLVNSGFIAGGNSFTPTGSWQVVSGIPSGGMIGSQVYMYKPGVIGTYGISGTIGGSGAGFPGWEVIGLALKGS